MNIFKNKKVLITGHTGFKGSWLTFWLLKFGAKITGISKDIPTSPSHYKSLNLQKSIKEYFLKIEDKNKIEKVILKEKPDFVFHLAAQAIVSKSFDNPFETWKSNTFGTLSILEALRKVKKTMYVVLITSDKSYKNIEIKRGYKESDTLGGDDPYSASKGSADILINSYIKSFFMKKKNKVFISVARAGNVIGGGDWSDNRLIPDCVKSCSRNKKLLIRNPNSTRPWQHVIEVVFGYIKLINILRKNKKKLHGEVFNFGPSLKDRLKVIDVIKLMQKYWKKINWKILKRKNVFYESKLLFLNSNKAKKTLKWNCLLTSKQTIELTSSWYKKFYSKKYKKMNEVTLKQINEYESILRKKKII